MGIGDLWNLIMFEPMLNVLIVLYSFLLHNFGLTIVVFTIIVRLLMYPLTVKQLRTSKVMADIQPKLKEIQSKYAKDQQKLSQETMKLYKEAGVNPLGCLGPMIIQLPIWIALYQAVISALATTPESLLALSQHLYSWPLVHRMVPLGENFLWLNLGAPDRLIILPVLVAGTMWVQQKMITMPGGDPKQQSMNRTMLMMMPLMFGFFTLQFPSGLAIYWVTSNTVGIIMQYFVTGWGGLVISLRPKAKPQVDKSKKKGTPLRQPTPPAVPSPAPASEGGEERKSADGKRRDKRQDSRRSDSNGSATARSEPGTGGDNSSSKG